MSPSIQTKSSPSSPATKKTHDAAVPVVNLALHVQLAIEAKKKMSWTFFRADQPKDIPSSSLAVRVVKHRDDDDCLKLSYAYSDKAADWGVSPSQL
jgi:hypothetical protein